MKAMAEQMKKMAEMAEKTGMTPPPRPNIAEHMAFESAMLGEFLPGLYKVWEGHPDPWQNVDFDLTTVRQEDGTWRHKYTNVPPTKKKSKKHSQKEHRIRNTKETEGIEPCFRRGSICP